MAARVLYCTRCNHKITIEREIPARCPNPAFQSSSWRSATRPLGLFKLTVDDRTFLKVNRILAEE